MLHPSEGELNIAHSDKSFTRERQHVLIERSVSKGKKQHIAEEHGGNHDFPTLDRLPFLARLLSPARRGGFSPFCIVPEWHMLVRSQYAYNLYQIVAQLSESQLYAPHDKGHRQRQHDEAEPKVAGKLSMNTFNCGTRRAITPSTRVARSRAMLTGAASCMAITHALPSKVRITGSAAPAVLKPANGILCKLSAMAMMNQWWAEPERNRHMARTY